MSSIEKYSNIEEELPKLPKILLNTIQSDVLEVKRVNKLCDKYIKACSNIEKLEDAEYVVFSKYIDRSNHQYEKFIFLTKDGEELFDISGAVMDLHGLLACTNLHHSEEYEALLKKQ